MNNEPEPINTQMKRCEISRIAGDIYLNGVKFIFSVDFNSINPGEISYTNVDLILGWAAHGMRCEGIEVPSFPQKEISEFKEKENENGK